MSNEVNLNEPVKMDCPSHFDDNFHFDRKLNDYLSGHAILVVLLFIQSVFVAAAAATSSVLHLCFNSKNYFRFF